jgi:hypothetical protein
LTNGLVLKLTLTLKTQASHLGDCSQVLKMLQVLRVDTNIVLDKKNVDILKQVTPVGDSDSEGRIDTVEEDVDIVFGYWDVTLDLKKCGDIESHPGPQRYALLNYNLNFDLILCFAVELVLESNLNLKDGLPDCLTQS